MGRGPLELDYGGAAVVVCAQDFDKEIIDFTGVKQVA
jgi:hypothetical protein